MVENTFDDRAFTSRLEAVYDKIGRPWTFLLMIQIRSVTKSYVIARLPVADVSAVVFVGHDMDISDGALALEFARLISSSC
jgi:hypothetical protein